MKMSAIIRNTMDFSDIIRRNQAKAVYSTYAATVTAQNTLASVSSDGVFNSKSKINFATYEMRNQVRQGRYECLRSNDIYGNCTSNCGLIACFPSVNISLLLQIISGNRIVSNNPIAGLTQISFSGIVDSGSVQSGILDDANIPLPLGGMVFNFFGINYSTNLYWNTNNAITFGTMSPNLVSVSYNTVPAILLGNYDRITKSLYYSNLIRNDYSITTLLSTFFNYYTDDISTASTYTYQIRLIKENTGSQKQYIEVSVITSPPSTGYSSGIHTYPSGTDIDTNGLAIDQTKTSPYNITNGVSFINPCGSTFSLNSPSSNTSFIFSSDSTGSVWTFTNNTYINV
jgi:hypothetical protein